ncbi:TPA: hypothetical protein ACN30P_004855 [Vibrio parahaemolyticus]
MRLLILLFFLFSCKISQAQCVTPLSNTQSKEKIDWMELESFNPSAYNNPEVIQILKLENGVDGDVNRDYYSVTIDKLPEMILNKFFDTFRKALTKSIFKDNKNYSLEPYSNIDKIKWDNGRLGAIMTFTLGAIYVNDIFNNPLISSEFNRLEFENGDVVLSCIDSESFIFSTVRTKKMVTTQYQAIEVLESQKIVKEDGLFTLKVLIV